MAENNIALTEAPAAPKLMLNGVEATAQQVYDAFMAGPMRVSDGGTVYAPIQIAWENSDGTQTNPKAVTYVEVSSVAPISDGSLAMASFGVGTKYTPEN